MDNRTLHAARIWARWDELEHGRVRLRIVPDDITGLDDLKGDCFNPRVNRGISPERLRHEEKQFEERVSRDGVWGIVGEYFDGEAWQHADSCFGFVGDSWRDSGYDVGIMAATIDAYEKQGHCPTCGRPTGAGGAYV